MISFAFNDIGSPIPLVSYTLLVFIVIIIFNLNRLLHFFSEVKSTIFFKILLLLYLFILLISLFNFVPYTKYSASFLRQLPVLIIIFFVLFYFISNSILDIKTILKYYLLGIFVIAILYFTGVGVTFFDQGRKSVLGINPNQIATAMNLSILFIFTMIYYYSDNKTMKLILLLFIPPILVISIASGSRGGVISTLLSILTFFYLKNSKKIFNFNFKNIIAAVSIVFIFGLIFISDPIINERFFDSEEQVNQDRNIIWENAFSIVSEDLILGVGVFQYEAQMIKLMGRYKAVHNEYLSILLYSGLIGLSLFLYFIFLAIKSAISILEINRNPLFISIMVILVFTLFKGGGFILSSFLWFCLAIIFGGFENYRVKMINSKNKTITAF